MAPQDSSSEVGHESRRVGRAGRDRRLTMDWATVVSHYQDDAVLMPPSGQAFSGPGKLRSLLEAVPRVRELESRIDEIDGCRDVAFVRAHFSLSVEPDGLGPVAEAGKWVQIWRRQRDGAWRVAVEIWNSDRPAAGDRPES